MAYSAEELVCGPRFAALDGSKQFRLNREQSRSLDHKRKRPGSGDEVDLRMQWQ
jgi:hypothetical protein